MGSFEALVNANLNLMFFTIMVIALEVDNNGIG